MLKSLLAAGAALSLALAAAPAVSATEPVADPAGLSGVYYPPAGKDAPLVLVLGGSEGGSAASGALAKALSDEGFAALAVAYFKAPGLPDALEDIPLETFTRALDFLAARPEARGRRIAIVGGSKGAEAALLVASRDARVCAVVAGAPSSVAWQGFNPRDFTSRKGSWTWAGQPLAFAPYDPAGIARGVFGLYDGGLAKAPAAAVIPVERIAGPVMLVSGGKDALWPSGRMAAAVMARLDAAKFRPLHVHLAYPEAGHAVFGRPWPDDKLPPAAALAQLGGTPEANQAARKDAWPQALDFLRRSAAGCARPR